MASHSLAALPSRLRPRKDSVWVGCTRPWNGIFHINFTLVWIWTQDLDLAVQCANHCTSQTVTLQFASTGMNVQKYFFGTACDPGKLLISRWSQCPSQYNRLLSVLHVHSKCGFLRSAVTLLWLRSVMSRRRAWPTERSWYICELSTRSQLVCSSACLCTMRRKSRKCVPSRCSRSFLLTGQHSPL